MKNNRMMATMSGIQMDEQRMTSLDIAEVTGKQHKDVLKAIRNMEPAWEKVCERKFALTSKSLVMPKGGVRSVPVFSLTKIECFFIATKFNDEARAKLVKRWYELECECQRMNLSRTTGQKLLVTESELVRRSDEIRREQISEENAPADGCFSASDVAFMLEMSVKELNRRLVSEGIQYRSGGCYNLTKEYDGRGFATERSFHYFGLDGEKKERTYMVWTTKGVEFIRRTLM